MHSAFQFPAVPLLDDGSPAEDDPAAAFPFGLFSNLFKVDPVVLLPLRHNP